MGLIAERSFAHSRIFAPEGSVFLAVGADSGLYRALGKFPRLIQMAEVSFGIGVQRKTVVLVVELARKPFLLLDEAWRIRADESDGGRSGN